MLNFKRLLVMLIIVPCAMYSYDIGLGTNYKDILIGDRAGTMGGAFQAISDDASGVYYNPAGLVYVPYSTFAGSANTVHRINMSFKNAIGTYDWDRESLAVKPNFFSMVNKHSEDLVWAVSYIVPIARVEDQHEVYQNFNSNGDSFIINLHDEDTTTYIGPSLSYKLSNELSIGATLYYFYRDRKLQANQFLFTGENINNIQDSDTFIWQTQDRVVKIDGIKPIVGIMWTPINKLSIGASIRTHLINTSKWSNNYIDFEKGSTSSTTSVQYNSDAIFSVEYPTQVSIGAAYFHDEYLILSSDIDYYHLTSKAFKRILNYSFGAEYFLKDDQAIRFGLFTNNSNVSDPTESTYSNRRANLSGFTGGYSIYGPTNYLTLGVVYATGKGKAQVSSDQAIVDYERHDLSFIISAGFGF